MEPTQAYAPPKSLVADATPDKPRIPLLFKAGLALYVLLALLKLVVGISMLGVIGPGVVLIAAWRTLAGSLAAARVLACLLTINGLIFLLPLGYGLLHAPMASGVTIFSVVFFTCDVLLSFGLAAYTVFSADMRAVHQRSERDKWSGA